jgi:hypothetical protein
METTQAVETVDNAIKFGAIALNAMVMILASIVVLAVFAIKSAKTSVATWVWLRENAVRFGIGAFLMIALAALMVVAPDVSLLLQTIGFNVDKNPLALGIAIGLLLVGATSEPSKNPEG